MINDEADDKHPPDTLSQKIGQLVAVGLHGTALEDASVQRVIQQAEAGLIGGVIIYRYNIITREQLTALLQGLHQANTPRPLFVFVDQEGGRIQRLDSTQGFDDTLSAKQVAATMSPQQARQHYGHLGEQLWQTGCNVDLAPCVDLDDEPPGPAIGALERSYGTDPAQVADYAGAMLAGLGDHRVLGCLKHYPGHGRARGDSHTGLTDITHTWTPAELLPFQRLINAGVVDAVMTSHLVHQDVDGGTAVTFSPTWLQRLREELGFSGVIVADDLHMGAIIRHYSLEDTLLKGLQAGLDMLMFSNNPLAAQPQGVRHDQQADVAPVETGEWRVPDENLPEKIHSLIQKAVAAGRLSEAVIDAAYARICKLKTRLA